jgi:hypothetical protein
MSTPTDEENGMARPGETDRSMLGQVLLACGIISSILYFLMVFLIGPLRWAGYSIRSFSVSELFAYGAPSRSLMLPLGIAYQILMIAFAVGVLLSAGRNRALKVSGWLLFAYGVVGLAGPVFAMHTRTQIVKAGPALTDNMHKVLTGVTVLLMLVAIGFGAAALRKWFRYYSIVTILALLVFGGIALPAASNIEKNLPTPWVGLTERISICVFLVWVVVLAVVLMGSGGGKDSDAALPDS